MMHKHTLVPRIFTFALSIAVAASTLCAWAGPALANDNKAKEILLAVASQDGEEKAKAGKQDEKLKGSTYTLTCSDSDKAGGKSEQQSYDGTSQTFDAVDLYKDFFDGNTSGMEVSFPDEPANASYDSDKKEITVSGTFTSPIKVLFKLANDDEHMVYISCDEGDPWDGGREAEGSAIYGQSDKVDLKDCLPDDLSKATLDTPVVTDKDSVLDGAPSVSNGELNFTFKNFASKVGKKATVVIPVSIDGTIDDKTYAPYEITVTLEVLDKEEQVIDAADVEGEEGEEGKTVDATLTKGDGDLSYEVTKGEEFVDVDPDTGALTLKKEGTATVLITAAATPKYKKATEEITVTVTAKDTQTYKVTMSDDGNGTATATPDEAEPGTKIELKATPADGYEFDGWEVVSPKDGVTIEDDSFAMPESDVEIKAIFKEKAETRSITFKANGGTGTMSKQTAEKGSTITLNANKFKRTGYTFTGWNTKKDGSGSTFKDKAKVKLNANATLYAQWKKNSSNNNSSSKKSSNSGSSSGSSSSKLAQTGDPTNFGLIAALAAGGGALVCVGLFANKKRGKGEAVADGADGETEAASEAESE